MIMEQKTFTFIWTIKNCCICLKRTIQSPTFTVEEFHDTRWHLELIPGTYRSTGFMGCGLRREAGGPKEIAVGFQLLHVSETMEKNQGGMDRHSFSPNEMYWCEDFALWDVWFFELGRSPLCKQVVIYVRLWCWDTPLSLDVRCYGITQFEVREVSEFTWDIDGFSKLSENPTTTIPAKNDPDKENPTFSAVVTLSNSIYALKEVVLNFRDIDWERLFFVWFAATIWGSKKGNKKGYDWVGVRIHPHDREGCLPFRFYATKEELHSDGCLDKDRLVLQCKIQTLRITTNRIQHSEVSREGEWISTYSHPSWSQQASK